MTRLPGISAELAAAYRAITAAYNRLPADAQERISIGYDSLEVEINRAITADDRPRAMCAIAAWRRHWLATFEEAAR